MKKTIITTLLALVAMAFSSCSSDEPHWADLEAPYGGEKRNYLELTAKYDNEDLNYMAYSTCLTFGYANETTLHIQGYYVHDDDGWANYQRGDAESSF